MPECRRDQAHMKTIKILHTADLHLDSAFETLSPGKAAIRRSELRVLPKKIASLAIREKADVVLLSGDLLDSDSMYRETGEELVENLAKIPVPVFIAPGNHDYYTEKSPYARLEMPEQVYLFTKDSIEYFDFPERGFRVYGAAFTEKSAPPLLQGFHAERTEGVWNLMCIHGEIGAVQSAYNPISEEEIRESGLDLLAVGHIHKSGGLNKAGDTWYSQPGCPEGRGFDETGRKTVSILELSDEGCTLREVPVASRSYELLSVDVTDVDPLFAVSIALPDETVRNIYRIILTGETEKPLNLPRLQEKLAEYFFELQLRDKTHLKQNIWEWAGQNTLRGIFLTKLKERLDAAKSETEREQIEQAVRWGLAALDNREEPNQHEDQ